jgi:hypothetical protein
MQQPRGCVCFGRSYPVDFIHQGMVQIRREKTVAEAAQGTLPIFLAEEHAVESIDADDP